MATIERCLPIAKLIGNIVPSILAVLKLFNTLQTKLPGTSKGFLNGLPTGIVSSFKALRLLALQWLSVWWSPALENSLWGRRFGNYNLRSASCHSPLGDDELIDVEAFSWGAFVIRMNLADIPKSVLTYTPR